MFPEELKEKTADAHLALERKMIPHLKNIASATDYTRLLDFLHRYYHPLEAHLEPHLPAGFHSHAANIRADISYLAPDHELSTSPPPKIPVIDSTEKALGVLYVLEGSTLGGQIITKMLAKQLVRMDSKGFSFYNPYGARTMERWQQFKTRLTEPLNDQQKQAVIDGANETFSTLNSWISAYESGIAQ